MKQAGVGEGRSETHWEEGFGEVSKLKGGGSEEGEGCEFACESCMWFGWLGLNAPAARAAISDGSTLVPVPGCVGDPKSKDEGTIICWNWKPPCCSMRCASHAFFR